MLPSPATVMVLPSPSLAPAMLLLPVMVTVLFVIVLTDVLAGCQETCRNIQHKPSPCAVLRLPPVPASGVDPATAVLLSPLTNALLWSPLVASAVLSLPRAIATDL